MCDKICHLIIKSLELYEGTTVSITNKTKIEGFNSTEINLTLSNKLNWKKAVWQTNATA